MNCKCIKPLRSYCWQYQIFLWALYCESFQCYSWKIKWRALNTMKWIVFQQHTQHQTRTIISIKLITTEPSVTIPSWTSRCRRDSIVWRLDASEKCGAFICGQNKRLISTIPRKHLDSQVVNLGNSPVKRNFHHLASDEATTTHHQYARNSAIAKQFHDVTTKPKLRLSFV